MTQPNECAHCAEWEICPFHPKPSPAGRAEPCESDDWGDPDDPNNPFVTGEAWNAMPPEAKAQHIDAGLKLLGPDDPEVSTDLIYRDEATGGLVSVPQAPERPASAPTLMAEVAADLGMTTARFRNELRRELRNAFPGIDDAEVLRNIDAALAMRERSR